MRKVIKLLFPLLATAFIALAFYGSPGNAQESVIRRAAGSAATLDGSFIASGGLATSRSKIQTNGTFNLASFGDSLVTGQLFAPIVNHFVDRYGFAGFMGPSSFNANDQWTYTNGGGAATVSAGADFSSWYLAYNNVPNGGATAYFVTNSTTGLAGVNGNVIRVAYIEENGAATFKIQTNAAPGGNWADMATGINANNGGAKHGVVLSFTNAFVANMLIRVVGTAAGTPVKVLQAGILNYSTPRGVTVNMFATGGFGLVDFFTANTNITGPVWASMAPDLMFVKFLDSAAQVATYQPQLISFMQNYSPFTDIVWVGANPCKTGCSPSDVIAQNANMAQTAIANRQNYFNGYDVFGLSGPNPLTIYTNGSLHGYLSDSVDPHPTASGDQMTSDLIMSWMGLFDIDSKEYGTIFYTYGDNSATTLTNVWLGSKAQNGSRGIHFGFNKIYSDNNMFVNQGAKLQWGIDPAVAPADAETLSLRNYTLGIQPNGQININDAGSHLYRRIFPYTNQWPAGFTVFTQTADGSATNYSTTTNTWWGSGTGSPRLEASTLETGMTIEGEQEGLYFTGATPGNCRVMIMLNSSTATNTCAQVLFAPTSVISAGDYYKVKFKLTCRSTGVSGTVSSSGTIEMQNAGAAVVRYFTNQVTTVDTTVQLSANIMSTNGATTDSFLGKNGGIIIK